MFISQVQSLLTRPKTTTERRCCEPVIARADFAGDAADAASKIRICIRNISTPAEIWAQKNHAAPLSSALQLLIFIRGYVG
jgi:hypothetical protein